MGWFALALSSVMFFTTLNLLQRVLAVKSRDPRAMSLVFNFIAAILAILIFFVTGSHKNFSLPTGYSAWIVLAVACLMYGLFERGRFYAAKYLDASTLIIVLNISVVVALGPNRTIALSTADLRDVSPQSSSSFSRTLLTVRKVRWSNCQSIKS